MRVSKQKPSKRAPPDSGTIEPTKFLKRRLCRDRSERVLRLRREGATALLHDDRGRISARLAAGVNGKALGQRGEEATHERIAGAVGVHELLLRKGKDRVQRHVAIDSDNRGIASL